MRRSPRLTRRSSREHENLEGNNDEDPDIDKSKASHFFEGVEYSTYQDMVNAKRKRNQQVLVASGLVETVEAMKRSAASSKKKRKKSSPISNTQRRKSNRLAGIKSDGMYVEDERAGRFSIGSDAGTKETNSATDKEEKAHEPEFYRNRINDGSTLSIQAAVELTGPKWVDKDSVANMQQFIRKTLNPLVDDGESPKRNRKNSSTMTFDKQVKDLQVDHEDCVAKVTPDRIYGIAAHPSTDKLIVCAGDKTGCVGIWNVSSQEEGDDVHLFRFHKGAASCLEWNRSGSGLLSASYDGTVRYFDVHSESFEQVFATYDSDSVFRQELGYKMDTGYRYWTQYACLDSRFNNEKCFFLSTSTGTAMHVDLRASGKGRVTFHEELSEKKINTLSLHPNGYSLLSAGLGCHVKLWDIRKFQDSRSNARYKPKNPIAKYNGGKSCNSAFFSPSGKYVVSTTMANKLDIFENVHQASKQLKTSTSVGHDNMTGRWLSTFMAKWHPELDIFVVGSMRRPRAVELFNPQGKCLRAVSGEALTAVASRCCFHKSSDRLTIVGGNSSGRVTVVR